MLKDYEFEEITIQQIADEADINRATFYKHYEDKYILLNTIEDTEVSNMQKYMSYQKVRTLNFGDTDSINNLLKAIPENVMQLILNNIELYEVIFKMKRRSALEDKISEAIANNLKLVLGGKSEIDNIPFRYFHAYVAGSMVSIIKLWVLDENRIPVEQHIENMFKIVYNGPLTLILNEVQN
ncbi:TetR/AcrR family transcriptional regulator C-terminal domain-containing protein [Staphylococcus equorum]